MAPAPEPEHQTLTAPQLQVLALLAEGQSIGYAAEEAGVHRNTIRNWRTTIPAFAQELDLAMREQTLAWRERCNDLAPKAISVLHGLLSNGDVSPVLRLRAALAVLKTSVALTAPPPAPEPIHLVHNIEIQNPAQSCTMPPTRKAPAPGRNAACPCHSGLKFKRCCGSPLAATRSAPA